MAEERKSAKQKPTHIDRPEVDEVFADAVQSVWFDGNLTRFEFATARQDESGRVWTYTAARLVLSIGGLQDLMGKLSQLQQALDTQRKAAKAPSLTPEARPN